MLSLLAKCLRIINHFLFFTLHAYLPGMLIFRLSRKIRNSINRNKTASHLELIDRCLGTLKMEVDAHSYMGGCLYWCGYHHINESLYLDKFLASDMCFVDIGANQGEFSLFASKKIKKGKIIAFEPVSVNHKKFQKNIELNAINNIELNKFGLSDKKGSLPIYTSSARGTGGINEGLSTLFASDEKKQFEETVDLYNFDDLYLENLDRLDFVKIDIEGSELFALKGMRKSLEKFKPELLIEINNDCFTEAGYKVEDLIRFLSGLGYKPYYLFRGKLLEHRGSFSKWGNYIFKV